MFKRFFSPVTTRHYYLHVPCDGDKTAMMYLITKIKEKELIPEDEFESILIQLLKQNNIKTEGIYDFLLNQVRISKDDIPTVEEKMKVYLNNVVLLSLFFISTPMLRKALECIN